MNIPVPVILSRGIFTSMSPPLGLPGGFETVSNEHQRRKPRCNEHRGKWVLWVTMLGGYVSMYYDTYVYIYIYMYGGLMVIYQGTKWTITLSKSKYLPSLKLTAKAPENGPKPKRKRSSSNHPFSGVLAVSFQGGYIIWIYNYIIFIYIYIGWWPWIYILRFIVI